MEHKPSDELSPRIRGRFNPPRPMVETPGQLQVREEVASLLVAMGAIQ